MDGKQLRLNPTRRRWLEYLAVMDGWHSWAHMPRCASGKRAVDKRTWSPMIDAGWIEAQFVDDSEQTDWEFRITNAGLAELARSST